MSSAWGWALRGWRRLTSMRTALVLLFLLAIAAVPGSLLPQRPLNPDSVASYIKKHGAWGRLLDHLGLYDVFGSIWFSAIYLLLAVSLIGCLVPRIRVHAKALRRAPLPAPSRLERLPEAGSFTVAEPPAEFAAVARTTIGRRWRTVVRDEPSGAVTVSAEKGYSRETANVIFHVALLVALVLIAVGRLYNYQGSLIVRQGAGFCNGVANYDSWKPGRLAAEGKVHPAQFCITDLSKFVATYTADGEATQFAADVSYTKTAAANAPVLHDTITVNHPLRLEGDRVYLIGHGFAPRVTVTMPDGTVRTQTANFVPTDPTTYLSEGVFKFSGFTNVDQSIGVSGLFAPTPVHDGNIVSSASPQVRNPVLGVRVFRGNLNDNGLAQSVYTLDTSHMHLIGMKNLEVGQTADLSGGVKVRFDGWVPWASIQVSHDPAQGWLLWAAAAMVVGLLGSLGVRRRRLWLRLTPSSDGPDGSLTVVSVGGLARSDSGTFSTEFAALLDRLRAAGKPAQEQLVPAGKE